MRLIITIFIAILLSMTALSSPLGNRNYEADAIDHARGGTRNERNGTTSYFFDFGENRSPVKDGYIGIIPEDRYDSETGYGLLSSTDSYYVTSRDIPEFHNSVLKRSWVYNEYADDLTVDGIRSQERVTFRVDLPNGSYRVKTWIGDLENAVYSMNISYNGVWLVEGAAAFHTVHRSMYFKDPDRDELKNYGCAVPYTREITVTDGSLIVNVTGNDTVFWDDLAEENQKNPPYSYGVWMSTGAYKYSTGTGPWRYIGGPFTNSSVLGLEIYPAPHLPIKGEVGSLILDESNVTDEDLSNAVDSINEGEWEIAFGHWVASTQTALSGKQLLARAQVGLYIAGDIHVDHELDIIPQVERDLENASLESPRELGISDLQQSLREFLTGMDYFINRGTYVPGARETKNHFYESNKAIIHWWRIEPRYPLYPKARLWLARALYTLDPHRWTSASGTGRDVMESLRYLDHDNTYISFYLDTERDVPRTWENGTPVISTIGENDHWFLQNYTAGFQEAPEWARILRQELCWLWDITDWWVDHKQQADGSIGGGWTDDVEMIGLFGFDALISEGADEKSMEGARKFVNGMLASGSVDMEKGYSAAFADTEHSAELTGDSLPMMVATDFGNPYWIEFSMKTAVLMRDLWMGVNELGFLQFKANHISATKVGTGGAAEDSWINFRAALPAWWVWWYSRDPSVEELFVRWAECWVNASMSTEKDKPEGVIPAMIAWPTGEIGGINAPVWYEGARNDGSVNYDWEEQQYKDYITSLLVSAFEATGDLDFIEPFRLEAELADEYLRNPGGRDPPPGSSKWAGMILGQNAIDRYQQILDSFGLPGGAESPELWNPRGVMNACKDGHDYIQKCYPLMTTEASATDRAAFIGIPNPFLIYTGGGTGGALLSPSFTYNGLGRDFAAMVRSTNCSYSNISFFGFFNGERTVDLVPWSLEPGARYLLRCGQDGDEDGIPDSIDYEDEFIFVSRGMEIPFPLPGRSNYALTIEIIENGTGWTLLPDPAFGDEVLEVDRDNDTIEVTVHNLGPEGTGEFEMVMKAVDGNGTETIMAQGIMSDLQPPSNLAPSIDGVKLNVFDWNATAEYYLLVIDPQGNLSQITTRNDERRIEVEDLAPSNDKPTKNQPPFISITNPDREADNADRSYLITWSASDPDDDPLSITLYFDVDTNPENRKFMIVTDIQDKGSYEWNTTDVGEGEYYIYVIADDGNGSQTGNYSTGVVHITHDGGGTDRENNPPMITITSPGTLDEVVDAHYLITWTASDPDGHNITISLYYDNDTNPDNGITIINPRLANSGSYEWATSDIRSGKYFIYGIAEDGKGLKTGNYSAGMLKIVHRENGDGDEHTFVQGILIAILAILLIILITLDYWYPGSGKS